MKNQKGITLIALIITIIVMLILVGVSVTAAINTGLFKTASGVSKNTEAEKENELVISDGQANLDGTYIDINNYVYELTTGLPKELKVGDIIEYIPKAGQTYDLSTTNYEGCRGTFNNENMFEEDVKWKVIRKNKGTVEIIPNVVSSSILTVELLYGWDNSINALNDICGALYGNTESTEYTATAKSLTAKDINIINNYEELKNWIQSESSYWLADTYTAPGPVNGFTDYFIKYVESTTGQITDEYLGRRS